jgi:hypothetical protein
MPYGNRSVTTGSANAVRRVNTPYDLGALDVRSLLSARGRLGQVPGQVSPRGSQRYPDMQSMNRVVQEGFSRMPFSPGAVDVREFLVVRGRLGQSLPPLRSSRYPMRAGPQGSWERAPIAGRYAGNGGHRLGQVAEIATAATSLAPMIASIQGLFGPGASGADAERQAKIYSYYEQSLTQPGSASSVDSVITLNAIANNAYDPIQRVQQNNPQITRAYAQQALQRLSSQGWINVNTSSPSYTGIGASGIVYASSGTSGLDTQTAVSQSALPPGNTAALGGMMGGGTVFGVPLVVLAAAGLGAVLLLRKR